jgi:hypothetical protein
MTTAEFQAEFLSHATLPKPEDANAILADYTARRASALAQAKELGVGKDGAKEIRKKMATAFIKRWMMLQYARLDTAFIKRPWWLHVTREGDAATVAAAYDRDPGLTVDPVTGCVAKIERFFRAKLDAEAFAFGKGVEGLAVSRVTGPTLPHGKRGPKSYRSMDLSFTARLPDGICDRHVRLAQTAIGHYLTACAALCRHGIDFTSELLGEDRYYRSNAMTVRVLWAPNHDMVSVTMTAPRPAGDPAIVLEVAGHSFLLDFYDTPDEQPIEHLIREFSEGRLNR